MFGPKNAPFWKVLNLLEQPYIIPHFWENPGWSCALCIPEYSIMLHAIPGFPYNGSFYTHVAYIANLGYPARND